MVIHRCRESTAFEVLGRIHPDFRDRIGLGIQRPDMAIPIHPELIGNFVGDIESPTVDPIRRVSISVRIHPTTRGIENVLLRTWV